MGRLSGSQPILRSLTPPARKVRFGALAPALSQPPSVFVEWMLGMADGPMRACTSFGTL